MKILKLCSLIFIWIFSNNIFAYDPIFGNRVDLGLIECDLIIEASGVSGSTKNPGVLWVHNDKGNLNRIFAINLHGKHLGIYTIDGADNLDWEDMAIGPGPEIGLKYIYIGDIGDNEAQRDLKYIYRIPEPPVDSSQTPVDTILYGTDKITFRYPDGSRDAETLMVDPATADIYIVSKREAYVRVYRAPYPQSTIDTITVDHVATLDLAGGQLIIDLQTVAGEISPIGDEILIKTYVNVFYWHRTTQQNLWDVFLTIPDTVNYVPEPQGEAIGWEPSGLGYYTISEERQNIPAHLYYYPRLTSNIDNKIELNKFLLSQNYPNPFNSYTKIKYELPKPENVKIEVFNLLGQKIETLVDEYLPAGSHEVEFAAKNLPSGVYYYRMQVGDPSDGSPKGKAGQGFQHVKKMILLK